MAGRVLVTGDGPIARVVLSQPGRRNAMSRAMWGELRDVFLTLQQQPDCRCILLQGDGIPGEDSAFCAGGDIAEYADFRFDAASLRDFHEHDVWGGLSAILACDVPVVAVLGGACMGAGLEIAACCDIRVAGNASRFGAPIARLGFPMAPREAQLLVAACGQATVRQLLLEAAVLDAAEMHRRGFVQHLVADHVLLAYADALAGRIASLAPQAARLTKRTLRAMADRRQAHDIEDRKAALSELAGAYDYAPSKEHREGVAAFLAKRPPEF